MEAHLCTQQELSDFRSEFSKKNEPERRSGLKKEPERRSGAFRSNSNPELQQFLIKDLQYENKA